MVSAANGESAYVVNGFLRGQLSPLILERNEAGFFDIHSDKGFLVRSLFGKATKQFELFEASRDRLEEQPSITWTEISRIPPASGAKFHANTLADTLFLGPDRQLAAICRERPLLRILLTKVVRFTPRRTAAPDAPPTTQFVFCSAFRM